MRIPLFLLIALSAVTGLTVAPAFAQERAPQTTGDKQSPAKTTPPVQPRPIALPAIVPFQGEPQLLKGQDGEDKTDSHEDTDTAVDPDTYRLGPGDQLAVGVTARTPTAFTVTVSPAGNVFVPTVGDVAVAGQTVSQAQDALTTALSRVRKAGTYSVSLRLTQLRRIRIQVLGEVEKPSVYRVGPTTRLLEALARAGGLTAIASRRHIQVRRAGRWGAPPRTSLASPEERRTGGPGAGLDGVPVEGGASLPGASNGGEAAPPTQSPAPSAQSGSVATLEIDLEAILLRGDTQGNLVVEAGDEIFVPRARAVVTLAGEVYRPGDYECDPGDTVATLLERAGGARAAGAISAVQVERPEEGDRRRLYPVDLTATGGAFSLQDRDRVVVPPLTALQGRLRVMGAVAGGGEGWQPDQDPRVPRTADVVTGTYTLRRGERVRDVIENLGGVTSKADLPAARVERTGSDGAKKVIPVDLHRTLVLQDPDQNPELQDGDTLIVPKKQTSVYVIGEVGRPGEQEYVEGKNVLDYIGAAGGPGARAKRKETVVVRTVGTQQQIMPARLDQYLKGKTPENPVTIQPGDIILVPTASIRGWQEIAQVMFIVRALALGFLVF
jgi:protein involved in polysaccharide export with SLBB domain